MKKVITTMSAMTIAAQFNGAQAEQQEQSQSLYSDSKMKYADDNNFKGSGYVDLSVEKTVTLLADNDDSGTVTEGDTLAYRIKIINNDAYDVYDIRLLDLMEHKLSLNVGTVSTSNGEVYYGNNPFDGDDAADVAIDYIPAVWFAVVNFEANVVNLSPGINVVENYAEVVHNPSNSYFYSDDPNTPVFDPTLIDANGAYPDLIFDNGFEVPPVSGAF